MTAIVIPLRHKYWHPRHIKQFKGISRSKGRTDNQPGKSFRDEQGNIHLVVGRGRSYRIPTGVPGSQRGRRAAQK